MPSVIWDLGGDGFEVGSVASALTSGAEPKLELASGSKSLTYRDERSIVQALLSFEWDEKKSRANSRKHGVTFDEAAKLFTSGVEYLEMYDFDHSDSEDRFVAIGPILRGVVLVVWTERFEDTIRIISARWATEKEVALYRAHLETNE